MNEVTKRKGRWHTLPGILTATAAVLTAVTGLIVALSQIGLFDRPARLMPQEQLEEVGQRSKEGGQDERSEAGEFNGSVQTAVYSVNLPAGTEVRVQDLLYQVLAARVDRRAPAHGHGPSTSE